MFHVNAPSLVWEVLRIVVKKIFLLVNENSDESHAITDLVFKELTCGRRVDFAIQKCSAFLF